MTRAVEIQCTDVLKMFIASQNIFWNILQNIFICPCTYSCRTN